MEGASDLLEIAQRPLNFVGIHRRGIRLRAEILRDRHGNFVSQIHLPLGGLRWTLLGEACQVSAGASRALRLARGGAQLHDPLPKSLALDVLHRDVGSGVRDAGIEDRADRRVIERRPDLGLLFEALHGFHRRGTAAQEHFDRDHLGQSDVLRAVDRPLAAFPKES